MKLPQFRSKFAWFILGLSLVTVLGAYVTTVMFDSTYFTATDTAVTLKGSLTNFAKLATNAFQEAGSYMPPSATLSNLSNGIGTNLTTLLPSAVQAGQTNDGTANWSASGTTNSTLPGAASVNSLVSTNGVNTGGLTNTGVTVHTPSAIQSLTVDSNVLVNASSMRVAGNGGAVTLTSTPSIQTNNIADGTVITIRGTSDANSVTFQDYRTLTGTCLAMEVATITLKNGSEMRFQWSNGNQRWQEMAFSANSSQNHPFKDITVSGTTTVSQGISFQPGDVVNFQTTPAFPFMSAPGFLYSTATNSITGNCYFCQLTGNGHLLYAIGRGSTTNTSGIADVNLLTREIVMTLHDPTWYTNDGPESVYQFSDGNYLVSDVDAKSQVYEMTPNGTHVWTYTNYTSVSKPITYHGTNAVIIFGDRVTNVTVIARGSATQLYSYPGATYINNGDYRIISGQERILCANWNIGTVTEVNCTNNATTRSFTVPGVSSHGPYSAEYLSDNVIAVAEGDTKKVSLVNLALSNVVWQSSSFPSTTISAHFQPGLNLLGVGCSSATIFFVPIWDQGWFPSNVSVGTYVSGDAIDAVGVIQGTTLVGTSTVQAQGGGLYSTYNTGGSGLLQLGGKTGNQNFSITYDSGGDNIATLSSGYASGVTNHIIIKIAGTNLFTFYQDGSLHFGTNVLNPSGSDLYWNGSKINP